MKFIDTLFVVALLNQNDQYHEKATALSIQSEGERFLTTDAVLLEIGNALARKFRAQATEALEFFLSAEDVEVIHLSPVLFEEAFALYKSRQDKEWGLVDCVSFIVMRQKGVEEALTFDQHFVQAGFRALMREPE